MNESKKIDQRKPARAVLLKILLFINGGIWLVFCLFGLMVGKSEFGLDGGPALLLLGSMAINGLILIAFSLVLPHGLLITFAAAGFISLNAVLSITDQLGLFDYIVLGINLLTLIFLFLEIRALIINSKD